MTSLCHQAVSVSAIRRRLSPQTRSHPSMTAGRTPSESWASIADTTKSSSSRTVSCGRGAAKPTASRTTTSSSSGMPVCALSCWKVVPLSPANRSKADTSMKENDSAPSRTAAAIPSSGTPARSRLCIQRALSTSPGENPSPAAGVRIPNSTNRSR